MTIALLEKDRSQSRKMWKSIDIVGFQSYSTKNVIITKFTNNDDDIRYTVHIDNDFDSEPSYYLLKSEFNNKMVILIEILKNTGGCKMDGLNLIGPKFYTILCNNKRYRILCSFDDDEPAVNYVVSDDYFSGYNLKTYDEIFSFYVEGSEFFPNI